MLTLVAGLCAGPALAQDFSAGKTPAQLFASDCAACHKSPGGLAKGQSAGSLTSFLREHYTTRPESAAALAAYLVSPGNARAAAQTPAAGPKPSDEKPAPKPRPAATAAAPAAEPDKQAEAAPREAAKPPVDPVVAKLNSYAAAGGEPKDTARSTLPANKLESYANSGTGAEATAPADQSNAKPKPADKKRRETTASTGDSAAPHAPRPRRAQAPAIQPVPDRQ